MKIVRLCVLGALAIGLSADVQAASRLDSSVARAAAGCQRLPRTCDTSCTPRGACAGDSCRGCGIYAGVEATFLQPYNTSSGQIVFDNGTNRFAADGMTEFDTLDAAPRIWLGYQGQTWGLWGRYWAFDAERFGESFDYVNDSNYRLVEAVSFLSAKTGDLEATRRFSFFQWEGDLFLGARWAELNKRDRMAVNAVSPGLQTALQQTESLASGAGLTFGFDGRRPIGCRGLALKTSARGSVIWTKSTASAYNQYSDPGNFDAQLVRVSGDCATLSIAEVQVGLEWARKLECFRAEAFTHIVAEYQWWNTDGQVPFLLTQTVNGTTTSVCSMGSDTELVGLAWAIGFRR